MAKPVYPFFAVLKALRGEAGLTVLEAAEATGYTKYERWESGKTAVGAQHLMPIANAFGIKGQDLGLFIYAWLVDRLAPAAGEDPVEVTRSQLLELFRGLPATPMDLGPYGALMAAVPSHTEWAVAALGARYHHAGPDGTTGVWLRPAGRSYVPKTAGRAGSLLDELYGNVVIEMGQFAARALWKTATQPGALVSGPAARPLANMAPLLARPETFEELAAESAAVPVEAARGLAQFAERAMGVVGDSARLFRQRREQVAAVLAAVTGSAPDEAEVDRLMGSLAIGDTAPVAELMLRAVERGVELPDQSGLDREARGIYETLVSGLNAAVEIDLTDHVKSADISSRMDLLDVLHSSSSD